MKHVNDALYRPKCDDNTFSLEAELTKLQHKIPVLSLRKARALGFLDESEPEKKLSIRARRERDKRQQEALASLGVDFDSLVIKRRTPGRPYQEPSDSFRAFVLVEGQRRVYRLKFGVKKVPAAETDKFIAWAMRLIPTAIEDRIREHLNKSQKLLPSAEKSKA